jgi:uncharacterized membrane protein YjjP (DUF1212 family)
LPLEQMSDQYRNHMEVDNMATSRQSLTSPRETPTHYTAAEQTEVLRSLLDLFVEAHSREIDVDVEDGTPIMTQAHVEQIESFLTQLCTCYQSYGCPTHTIEESMRKVAKGLGVEAHFLVYPSHAIFELSAVKTEQGSYHKRTQFFRTSFGWNFYKLQLVDELARRISAYAIDSDVQVAQTTEGADEETIGRVMGRARSMSETVNTLPVASPTSHMHNYGSVEDDTTSLIAGVHSGSGAASPSIGAGSTISAQGSPGPVVRRISMLLPDLQKKEHSHDHHHAHHGHQEGRTRKLSNAILEVARLGPNVYNVGSGPGRPADTADKYRTVVSKLALEDGITLIRAIIRKQPLYSNWCKSFHLAFAAFSTCGLFFGGSWTDMVVAFCLGLLVARMEYISYYSPSFSRVFEFVGTFVASIIIRFLNQHWTHLCYRAVLMSTIVFSLQGTTITLAFIDLMTKDLITGTTRLFYGMLISAMIGFAMDLSTSTYAALAGRDYDDVSNDTSCGAGRQISHAWFPLLFLISTLCFNMIVEGHYKQLLPMEFICACGFGVYYITAANISNELPSLLAAFTAACVANLYCRFTGHPPVVYIIPVVFLLVPGSVAASSFFDAFSDNMEGGMDLMFSVVTGALAIAVGLFAASAVVQVPEVEELFHSFHSLYPGPHSAHTVPGEPGKTNSDQQQHQGQHRHHHHHAPHRNSALTI